MEFKSLMTLDTHDTDDTRCIVMKFSYNMYIGMINGSEGLLKPDVSSKESGSLGYRKSEFP